ncbi:MAG: EAL domain-containing protein [Alphaproteobacteria bacterium]
MNTLSPILLFRLVLVGVFVLIAVAGTWMLDDVARLRNHGKLKEALTSANLFTAGWVSGLYQQMDKLAADPRVRSTLTGENVRDPQALRRAMYEFGYLQKLPRIYVYSPQLENEVIHPATTTPPTAELVAALRSHHQQQNGNLLRLIAIDGVEHILVSVPILSQGTATLGLAAFIEPVTSALLRHKKPSLEMLRQARALLIDAERIGGAGVIIDILAPQKNALDISEQTLETLLAGDTGFVQLDTARLVAGVPVANAKGWIFGLSLPKSAIVADVWPFKLLLYMLCTLGVIIGLFVPLLKQLLQRVKVQKQETADAQAEAEENLDYHQLYEKNRLKRLQEGVGASPKFGAKKQPTAVRGPSPDRKMADMISECLDKNRTKLLFQPVVDAATKQVIMAEVFLRLLDANGNTIPPAEFFPAARKFNMIPRIDAYVVNAVLTEYIGTGLSGSMPIAINLGGDTFESISFLQTLMMNFQQHLASGHVIFELRAREIVEDPRALDFVNNCRSLGCKFSIDYFGGGEAMISGAKRMKFDYIKLDALSFSDTEAMKDLAKLALHAKSIDMPIILERVEGNAMDMFAQKANIPFVQGYHYGKPGERLPS